MSVVVTRSVRCHFNSPPQQGQRMLVTGTSTGSASAVAGGASRRWKGPCPGFRPGRLQWALRLPLENGVADRALLRRIFSSFFTSSRTRSFSVWTRVNSPRRDWFSSSKSSIRWQLSSGSGPVIQTTVTDPARNVQEFSFRWSTSYGPVCPAMPVIRYGLGIGCAGLGEDDFVFPGGLALGTLGLLALPRIGRRAIAVRIVRRNGA